MSFTLFRVCGPRSVLPGLLLLLQFGMTGCTDQESGDGPTATRPLLVLAAASLNAAMPEVIEIFERSSGVEVDLVLGSTGNLAAQIANGAPADLFFSADGATVDRLVGEGELSGESVVTYATGQLVLAWRDGVEPPSSLRALPGREYEAISIANPEHAPYGAAARQALRSSNVWDEVEGRIIQGENVAQAYQFVLTGNADVAIVARSVVEPSGTDFMPVDPSLHDPLRQSAAVLTRSTHPAAQPFLDFVANDAGQAILAAHGFPLAAP